MLAIVTWGGHASEGKLYPGLMVSRNETRQYFCEKVIREVYTRSMPHIHVEPGQIDHTVTGYILYESEEPKVLLHFHKKLKVLLPVGGHIELNETPWAALIHEMLEESGYEVTQLSVLQPKSRVVIDASGVSIHPLPAFVNTHAISKDHYHSDQSYFLSTSEPPAVGVAAGESSDLRWLSLDEIVALSPDLIYNDTRQMCVGLLQLHHGEWDKIPAEEFTRTVPS